MKSILNLLNEENILVSEYNDAVSAAEHYEYEAEGVHEQYEQYENPYDYIYDLLREAETYRAYSYHLEDKINEKRKEIAEALNVK